MKLAAQTQGFDPADPANTDVLAFWQTADFVKAVNCPDALKLAKPGSVKVYRHVWGAQPLDNPEADADLVCDEAERSGCPDVIVEGPNEEYGRLFQGLARYCDYLVRFVARCHARGHRMAGLSWASGAFEKEDWDYVHSRGWCGMDFISVHGYWADVGPTVWNAYRAQVYWEPGDPLIMYTECGRDKVADGANGESIGKGGWIADGVSKDQYLGEIKGYSSAIQADPCVLCSFLFILRGDGTWTKYELASIASDLKSILVENNMVQIDDPLVEQYRGDFVFWMNNGGVRNNFRKYLIGAGKIKPSADDLKFLADEMNASVQQIRLALQQYPFR